MVDTSVSVKREWGRGGCCCSNFLHPCTTSSVTVPVENHAFPEKGSTCEISLAKAVMRVSCCYCRLLLSLPNIFEIVLRRRSRPYLCSLSFEAQIWMFMNHILYGRWDDAAQKPADGRMSDQSWPPATHFGGSVPCDCFLRLESHWG